MTATDALLGMVMRFTVTVDGQSLSSWSKASGLEVTWDLVEYRAGDNDNDRWIFPGLAKYPTVKLERAANEADSALVRTWLNNTSFKHEGGKTAKIELQDASLKKVGEEATETALAVFVALADM